MSAQSVARVSRTGLEEFIRCPRCAYMKYAMDLWPPRSPPFTLNLAVDRLLKAEFDRCREDGGDHPWIVGAAAGARPFVHRDLDAWRDFKRGLARESEEAGVTLYGAIDDLWVGADGAVHVVDYKATASASAVNMEQGWHDAYRRQAEVYQWLLRGQGIKVSSVAYFLFCVVDDDPGFGGALHFTPYVVAYEGSDEWVPGRLAEMSAAMSSDRMPRMADDCESCQYRRAVRGALVERGWLR